MVYSIVQMSFYGALSLSVCPYFDPVIKVQNKQHVNEYDCNTE